MVVYDDDHYYMGGVLAELLVADGNQVAMSPRPPASPTGLEHPGTGFVPSPLLGLGVVSAQHRGRGGHAGGVETNCTYSARVEESPAMPSCSSPRVSRGRPLPRPGRGQGMGRGRAPVGQALGDAGPGPIAWAPYAGHRYARELESRISATGCPSGASWHNWRPWRNSQAPDGALAIVRIADKLPHMVTGARHVMIMAGLLAMAGSPVPAVAGGNAEHGRKLAETHCARCHVLPGEHNMGIGSTPSFKIMVASKLPDWRQRFESFYALRPHPNFVRIRELPQTLESGAGGASFRAGAEGHRQLMAFVDTLAVKYANTVPTRERRGTRCRAALFARGGLSLRRR